jgi:urea transport system substrate-binding protein
MKLDTTGGAQPGAVSRRDFLRRGAAVPALAAAASLAPVTVTGCGGADGPPPIKVGILHAQTGTMAMRETALRDAEVMAIEEINDSGGVLGRPLEPVIEDTRSRVSELAAKKARKLLADLGVVVVFGCWTSESRKSVLPVFEELNGLLFYPVQYEGNESSRNVIYTGATPNQQILPAIDWLQSAAGGLKKRFFLLGSDSIYARTVNYVVAKHLQSRTLAPVGESYVALEDRDFKPVMSDVKTANPDVIVSTISGSSHIAFFDELAAQGLTAAKLPVLAFSLNEDDRRYLAPARVKGHLAARSYCESIATPRNKEFLTRFRENRGRDRVTDDSIEAAYFQVYLWKLAVESAGSLEVDKVREAFRKGIEFEAPGGQVKIDPKTHHTFKRFRVGRIRSDRQFDVIFEAPEWIEPDPYPAIAFPGWHCDWTQGGITKGTEVKIGMPAS